MRLEPAYLPTPRQIVDACRQIRQKWSPEEHRRRLVGQSFEMTANCWSPPRIDTSACHSRVRRVVSELTA